MIIRNGEILLTNSTSSVNNSYDNIKLSNSTILERNMSLKPGQNTGRDGGIYREQGPRGGLRDNYSTIPDRTIAPPNIKAKFKLGSC